MINEDEKKLAEVKSRLDKIIKCLESELDDKKVTALQNYGMFLNECYDILIKRMYGEHEEVESIPLIVLEP